MLKPGSNVLIWATVLMGTIFGPFVLLVVGETAVVHAEKWKWIEPAKVGVPKPGCSITCVTRRDGKW